MLAIHQTAEALSDVVDIADYIASRADLRTADRVIAAIRRSYEVISASPTIGYLCGLETPYDKLRCHVVSRYPNYLVFYEATSEDVIIRRVIYGTRDVRTIFMDA